MTPFVKPALVAAIDGPASATSLSMPNAPGLLLPPLPLPLHHSRSLSPPPPPLLVWLLGLSKRMLWRGLRVAGAGAGCLWMAGRRGCGPLQPKASCQSVSEHQCLGFRPKAEGLMSICFRASAFADRYSRSGDLWGCTSGIVING